MRRQELDRIAGSTPALEFRRGNVHVYVRGEGSLDDAELAATVVEQAALYASHCPQIVVGLYAIEGSWHVTHASCTFGADSNVPAEIVKVASRDIGARIKNALTAAGFAFSMERRQRLVGQDGARKERRSTGERRRAGATND